MAKGEARSAVWHEGHATAMADVAKALGLEAVSLEDLAAIRQLLDEGQAIDEVSSSASLTDPGERRAAAAIDPIVYGWAIWRGRNGLFHRVRMHVPVRVVLDHAIGDPAAEDLLGHVGAQIERDLNSEAVKRGVRWT